MKTRFSALLVGLLLTAGVALGGVSGISNNVTEAMQPGLSGSENSLQANLVLFNDRLVSWLDHTFGGTAAGASAISNVTFNGTVVGSAYSNQVGTIYGSNLTVVTGGSVTVPAGSIAGASVASPITVAVVSNQVAAFYGSNLTVKAGGTVVVPAGSIASASIAAGSMLNATTLSNVANVVYTTNLIIVAGGSISVPAGTIDATEIGNQNFDTMVSNTFTRIAIDGTNYMLRLSP